MIDDPLDKVADYEARLLTYLRDNHAPFRDKLVETKTLDEEAEEELDRICGQFTEAYLAGKAPDPR